MEHYIIPLEQTAPTKLVHVGQEESACRTHLLTVMALEVRPRSLDCLRVSSGIWIDKVFRVIHCVVLVELRQLVDAIVRRPHIIDDGSARKDKVLYQMEKSAGVTSLHGPEKTSSGFALYSSKDPLLLGTKLAPVILSLSQHCLVDLDNHTRPSNLSRILSEVGAAHLAIEVHEISDGVRTGLASILKLHVEVDLIVSVGLTTKVVTQLEDFF